MDELPDLLLSSNNLDVGSDIEGQEIWEFYEDLKPPQPPTK